ncbi:MAG: PhzF family phenazine biosynthesis protein [Methanobacteriota archaeon]
MKIKVLLVHAFAETKAGGNPAGVVLDAPVLTDQQMMQVSKQLRVSETAFVFPSTVADYRIRFFSPVVEVDLCGHATIATFFSMAVKRVISSSGVVTQETNVGVLPVRIVFQEGVVDKVMMTQGAPVLKEVSWDVSDVAEVLGVLVGDIDGSLPQQVVSTGLFTVPVCVRSFDVLKRMKPDFVKVAELCRRLQVGSVHVFTFETVEEDSVYHARNFAPLYGVNEDPVTGTANGAVVSYLVKNGIRRGSRFCCEQGDIINRPGRVYVEIMNDTVQVGGRARIVEERSIEV